MKNREVVKIQKHGRFAAGQLSEPGVGEDSLYFNMRKSLQTLHNGNLKIVKSTVFKSQSVHRRFGNAVFFTYFVYAFHL